MSANSNIANWTKSDKGWQLIVTFNRHWEAPSVGEGLGKTVYAHIVKRGEYFDRKAKPSKLKLTSRVFKREGVLKAYAKEA